MQPVIFPESGELVINNFENGEDELIVVDIATGELLSRAKVNARLANGMFLTPGFNRDIFYCTTGTFFKSYLVLIFILKSLRPLNEYLLL